MSRTAKQKNPGGNKSAIKQGVALKFFNAYKPFWHDTAGWIGWMGETEPDFEHGGVTTLLHEAILNDWDTGIDYWKIVDAMGKNLEPARLYKGDPYFMHYWLSRIVEWHGYAIYSTTWNFTMKASEGTQLSHPYRQRIEASVSERIKAADKAAAAAELLWIKRFP